MNEVRGYKVVLFQSDGERDLEWNENCGDSGDLFLGQKNNRCIIFISNLFIKVNNGVVIDVFIIDISIFVDVMMFMVSVSEQSVSVQFVGKIYLSIYQNQCYLISLCFF